MTRGDRVSSEQRLALEGGAEVKGRGGGELEVVEEGGGVSAYHQHEERSRQQWNRTSAVQISQAASSSNRTKAVHLHLRSTAQHEHSSC